MNLESHDVKMPKRLKYSSFICGWELWMRIVSHSLSTWNMSLYDINKGPAWKEIHQCFRGLKHPHKNDLPSQSTTVPPQFSLSHCLIYRSDVICEIANRGSQSEVSSSGWGERLTCSGAACWTVWAGKPRVSGSSRCWSGCRCDFSAPARSAGSPAAHLSASSAPAPAWELRGEKVVFELLFHRLVHSFQTVLSWS